MGKNLAFLVGILCVAHVVQSAPVYDAVRFFLFPDPLNPDYAQELIPGDTKSLLHSKYNKWNFPVLLIHGFGQNYSTNFPQLTKDAYLKQKIDANVITVDWSRLTQPMGYVPHINTPLGYPLGAIDTQLVGRKVAEFVVFLINHGVLSDPTRVHVVGFSLGAQIASIAGQSIRHYTGKPIQRITGLDPAGPLFQYHPLKGKRLDHSDAYFVDIIHSNQGRYGSSGSSGHVDFFPNGGGPEQPGCTLRSDIPGLPGSCAHGRSWEYFTETILDSKIWACKAISYKDYQLHKPLCNDKIPFGLHVPPSARGSYFFDIIREDPAYIKSDLVLQKELINEDLLREEYLAKGLAREALYKAEYLNKGLTQEEILKTALLNKEYAKQELIRKDLHRQEFVKQELLRKELDRQELLRKESARQELLRKDLARQELLRREAARQELIRKEAVNQELLRKDLQRKELLRQEALRRDEVRQELLRKELAREVLLTKELERQEYLTKGLVHAHQAHQEQVLKSDLFSRNPLYSSPLTHISSSLSYKNSYH